MTDTPRLEEKVFWDHVASEEDKASCLAQPNSYSCTGCIDAAYFGRKYYSNTGLLGLHLKIECTVTRFDGTMTLATMEEISRFMDAFHIIKLPILIGQVIVYTNKHDIIGVSKDRRGEIKK